MSSTQNERGLRLLSIDGGGIRGLSSLLILKGLMDRINKEAEGLTPMKPCDFFDLIGGTSTGGLIAIMLGKLKMSTDECIEAYLHLAEQIFGKSRQLKLSSVQKSQFGHHTLENAVKELLQRRGFDSDALLMDDQDESCKVCVYGKTATSNKVVHLTNFSSHRQHTDMSSVKIWEAARATSAAISFFDPITIGEQHGSFVDAGLGINNPVQEVWNAAKDVWGGDGNTDFSEKVRCLVSIGTGHLGLSAASDHMTALERALAAIATDTEATAERFAKSHGFLTKTAQYFRFNRSVTLEEASLGDFGNSFPISAATQDYMSSPIVLAQLESLNFKVSDRRRLGLPREAFDGSLGTNRVTDVPDDASDSGYESSSSTSSFYETLQDGFSSLLYENETLSKTLDIAGRCMISQDFQIVLSRLLRVLAMRIKQDAENVSELQAAQAQFFERYAEGVARMTWLKLREIDGAAKESRLISRDGIEIRTPSSKSRSLEQFLADLEVYRAASIPATKVHPGEESNHIAQAHVTEDLLFDPEIDACFPVLEDIRTSLMTSPIFNFFTLDLVEVVAHASKQALATAAVEMVLSDPLSSPTSENLRASFDHHHYEQVDLTRQLFGQLEDYVVTEQAEPYPAIIWNENIDQWVICKWELPAIAIRLQESAKQAKRGLNDWIYALKSMIVLTGCSEVYEADTCQNFLDKVWGSVGVNLLELLIPSLCVAEREESHCIGVVNFKIRIQPNHIVLHFPRPRFEAWQSGSLAEQHRLERDSILQAMMWLCQAIRIDVLARQSILISSGVQTAHAIFDNGKSQVLTYSLKPLAPLQTPAYGCWTSLFTNGIVAEKSLKRSWGWGLEVDFDLMLHLAAIESSFLVPKETPVELAKASTISETSHPDPSSNEGVILIGFFTALIPMKRENGTGSIQWHLEFNENEVIDPYKLKSTKGEWLQVADASMLRSTRCFVGWSPRANIMLGTSNLKEEVQWTQDLIRRSRTLHRKGYTIAGQLATKLGPLQPAVSIATSMEYSPNRQRFSASNDYTKAMTIVSRQVALVWDQSACCAWLVPKLSLILHMSHAFFRYHNGNNSTNDPIPYAIPSPDGSGAALAALWNHGNAVVRKFGAQEEDFYYLRQLLLDLTVNLAGTNETREMSSSSGLLASELMDLTTEPSGGSDLRFVKAEPAFQTWRCIANQADVVTVCAGLGPAIQSVNTVANPQCSIVPHNRGYLAAHMWCLQRLVEREGFDLNDLRSRKVNIGPDHTLCLREQCFAECSHKAQSSCWEDPSRILQEANKRSWIHGSPHMQYSRQASTVAGLPVEGAVVFGVPLPNKLRKMQKCSNS